jgi:hypothetical protein
VKDTPNLIKRILSFLDSLNSIENKKIVLRVISLLGENRESTLEIGRLEGFRQILKLLLAKDQELTQEILQTLKHLMDAQATSTVTAASNSSHTTTSSLAATSDSGSMDGAGGGGGLRSSGQHFLGGSQTAAAATSGTIAPRTTPSQTPYLRDLVPVRVRQTFNDVTKMVLNEMHKMFNRDTLGARAASSSILLSPEFIPLAERIDQERVAVKQRRGNPPRQLLFFLFLKNASLFVEQFDKPTSSQPLNVDELLPPHEPTSAEAVILKEFLRVQGSLAALTATLREAALTVQLDWVETLSKLIFKNHSNQSSFKKMNGYELFPRLFDSITDFSSEESHLFLQVSFFQHLSYFSLS